MLVESYHNLTLHGGVVNGGGEVRLAARDEFPNNSDIFIAKLSVSNINVQESPCGINTTWVKVTVTNGSVDVCDQLAIAGASGTVTGP